MRVDPLIGFLKAQQPSDLAPSAEAARGQVKIAGPFWDSVPRYRDSAEIFLVAQGLV